jgi:catechol 2,3-dioxygenase-like lactoylglutathione lyase family enzyme
MLSDSTVIATIAVKDINDAKKFYGDKLGLKQVDENPGGVTYQSGSGKLFVYPAPTAGSGQATCAFWDVDDAEAVVKELADKGISFEHYDMPGGTREGDLHIMGPMKAAWFKDPDGNILGLGSDGK